MAFSEYNYIGPLELPTYIHKMASVTDEDLAAGFISDAEVIIDAYVGPSVKFYASLTGETGAAASGTTLQSSLWGSRRPNYWAKGGVYVELVDNVPAALLGQSRLIVASDEGQVTLATAFSEEVPAGATFYFRQRSKFPRRQDQDTLGTPRLRHELKRATALQVEYGFQFGSEAFGLGDPDIADGEAGVIQSRTYGSGYSESRVPNLKQGLAYLIAPRARAELRNLLGALGWVR